MNPFDTVVTKVKKNPFDTATKSSAISTPVPKTSTPAPIVDTRNPVTKALDTASGFLTDTAKRAAAGDIFGGLKGKAVPSTFSSALQEGNVTRAENLKKLSPTVTTDTSGKIKSIEGGTAGDEATMFSPIGAVGSLLKDSVKVIAASKDSGVISDYLRKLKVPEEKIPNLSTVLTEVNKPQVVEDIVKGAISEKPLQNPVFQGSKIASEAPVIEKSTLSKADIVNQAAEKAKVAEPTGVAPADMYPASPTYEKQSIFSEGNKIKNTVQQTETALGRAQQDWEAISKQAQNEGKTSVGDSLLGIVSKTPTDVKDRINVLDYMRTPHYVLEKIGLGKEAKMLSTSFRNYLKELPQNINKITAWSKAVSKESNPRIFDWLDGKSVQLTPEEQKVGNEIKSWLNQWADRLGMKENERISNYITHIFPAGKGGELNEEIAKLIKYQVPGSVYDPYLLKRLGNQGYLQDTWAALDAYVKTATRKVHMDPVLEKVKAASQDLEVSQMDYVKKYIDSINMRPTGLDTAIDNGIKSVVGYKLGVRPTKNLTAAARRIVGRAKLGVSVLNFFKNLTQGINTFAELGSNYTLRGYTDLAKYGTKELEEVGVNGESMVEDRTYNAIKKFWEKADKGIYYNFTASESINRGAAYYGAKSKALAEGKTLEEAVDYGREIAGKTQFLFGSIDTPVALSSDIVKTIAQFQTFNIKQIEFLAEKMKNREYRSLIRYITASAVVYGTIGEALGMNMWDMLPGLRFGTPPSIDLPNRIFKNVTGTPDQYGKTPTVGARVRDTGKALLTDVVPGGTQIDRTIGGLGSVMKGKSTAQGSGNFQYKIKKTPENYIRGALFGKSNLPEAKAYQDKKSGKKVKVQKSNPFD